MKYEIKGGSFPIVECTLNKGESMITQSGAMCWMDSDITMETSTNGSFENIIGRLLTREKLFQNIYTSNKDDSKIVFGTTIPGSIMAINITHEKSIICQKSAFLCSYGNIELSTVYNKNFGVGLFGGEGIFMQKISGEGIVFLEIDGSCVEIDLKEGEKKIISTGYLISMEENCSMDIQAISGAKNIILGGEGFFNTVVTGPGKIIVQTMPVARIAKGIIPYLPRDNSNLRSN